jgi:hypothetical protein
LTLAEPLHDRQEFGVQGQLKNGCRLGLASELAIINLVRPATELAGALNPAQHIRPPKPSPVRKGRLGDNIHASLHCREGFGYCPLIIADFPEIDYLHSLGCQMLEIRVFVLGTALPEHPEIGRMPDWR